FDNQSPKQGYRLAAVVACLPERDQSGFHAIGLRTRIRHLISALASNAVDLFSQIDGVKVSAEGPRQLIRRGGVLAAAQTGQHLALPLVAAPAGDRSHARVLHTLEKFFSALLAQDIAEQ